MLISCVHAAQSCTSVGNRGPGIPVYHWSEKVYWDSLVYSLQLYLPTAIFSPKLLQIREYTYSRCVKLWTIIKNAEIVAFGCHSSSNYGQIIFLIIPRFVQQSYGFIPSISQNPKPLKMASFSSLQDARSSMKKISKKKIFCRRFRCYGCEMLNIRSGIG